MICLRIPVLFGKRKDKIRSGKIDKYNGKEAYFTKEMDGMPVGCNMLRLVGLAHTTGVKSSIINGMNVFMSIFVAAVCFRQEKITRRKLLGCLLGFAGVVLVNVAGGGGFCGCLGFKVRAVLFSGNGRKHPDTDGHRTFQGKAGIPG